MLHDKEPIPHAPRTRYAYNSNFVAMPLKTNLFDPFAAIMSETCVRCDVLNDASGELASRSEGLVSDASSGERGFLYCGKFGMVRVNAGVEYADFHSLAINASCP